MVRISTVVVLVGIGLIFVPIPPPLGIIAGGLLILAGLALRLLTDL